MGESSVGLNIVDIRNIISANIDHPQCSGTEILSVQRFRNVLKVNVGNQVPNYQLHSGAGCRGCWRHNPKVRRFLKSGPHSLSFSSPSHQSSGQHPIPKPLLGTWRLKTPSPPPPPTHHLVAGQTSAESGGTILEALRSQPRGGSCSLSCRSKHIYA